MTQKVKYIHLLWRDELKFNEKIVKLINENLNSFDKNSHLFVTPHRKVYIALKEFDNVILDNRKKNLFNYYADSCDFLISHSLKSIFDILFIKNKNCKKVLLRYWGGSLTGFKNIEDFSLLNIIKRILNDKFINKVKKFGCIGIANIVDEIDLRKTYKEIPLYIMPYVPVETYKYIVRCKNNYCKHSQLNVMIGHRGKKEGNHLEMIKLLEKYNKNNIKIYIPLSYGDKEYIKFLKSEIINKKNKNLIIIENFMETEDYIQFLNKMDICIFDGINSYALGNISILLSLGKTICLNDKSILKEAFDLEKIPYKRINDIDRMDYKEFSTLLEYDKKTVEKISIHNKEFYINKWKELFEVYG